MNTRYLLLIFILFLFTGCESISELPSAPDASAELTEYTVEADGGIIDVVVTSGNEVTLTESPEWVTQTDKTISGNKHIYTFRIDANISLDQRMGEIKFATGSKSCSAKVAQGAYPPYVPSNSLAGLEEIIEKMELEVVGKATVNGKEYDKKGYAHSERVTAPFYRVWDGAVNSNPFYSVQEKLGSVPANYWPVRLDLYLPPNSHSMDHVLYYTTTNNQLGAWGEVEIWVSDNPEHRNNKDETGFVKVGEMDCEFKWKTVIAIPATVKTTGVRTVRLIVKNALDNGTVICASANQLEVYGQMPFDFSATDLFTDNSCTSLKEGIDAADIANYPYPMFQNAANYLYLGIYPQERILSITEPAIVTIPIQSTEGQTLLVMAESPEESTTKIDILGTDGDNILATYTLYNGINLLKNCKGGRIRVHHEGPIPAKLNFMNGQVIK